MQKNMNLLAQSSRSIVCFANSIYANRINSRGMSRVFCDFRSQKTPCGILPVNSNISVTVHTPLSREVFWHEYAKIPRHTSQNSIAVGNLE